MKLEILPTRLGGAAENMATDFLLLQRHPRAGTPWFRHYGWHRPAFTFGYSQKISFVREQLSSFAEPTADKSAGERFELCRRATGGGVVDHRDDWTYALVIPRGHPLEELRATQSYREIHEALAAALRMQGVPAVTKPSPADISEGAVPLAITMPPGLPSVGPVLRRLGEGGLAKEGVCFQRAEIFDVIHEGSGEKIAGAAQKRNKRGLLFQGSIWRPAVGAAVDWERFHGDFVAGLAKTLGVDAGPTPWPEVSEDELGALVEQYASPEWNEFR